MASPPPSYTSPSSMSRSQTRRDDIQLMMDAMLRSSLSGSSSTSSIASSPPPYPVLTPTSLTTSRTGERPHQVEEQLEGLGGGWREGSGCELTAADRKRRVDMLNRDLRAKGAGPEKPTEGMFKKACSTDLLFLVDTTGSMASYINAAKTQVKSIMDDIKEAFLNEAEVRIAVVGYKDHSDSPNIEFLDFTTSSDNVRSFLDKLRATGGADLPEDVLGGLQKAIGATWKHQTRCIIHIADAPPHGCTLHDLGDLGDTYSLPGSEPHGLTHAPLLTQMIGLNLNYALLRITHHTDRMIFTFLEAYSAASADCKLLKDNNYYSIACDLASDIRSSYSSSRNAKSALLLEEQELGTSYNALRHLVVRSVTNSASRSAVRMIKSFAKKEKDKEPRVSKLATINLASISEDGAMVEEKSGLERQPPQWDTPGWLSQTNQFEGFSPDVVVHNAKTLNNMMSFDEHIKLSVMQLAVRRRPRPFAEGALRQAFYARTAFSTNRFVVKSFKAGGKNIAHLAEDMRCQALCKAFALEFNALAGEDYSIDFIVTTCLQAKTSIGLSESICPLSLLLKANISSTMATTAT